MKVIEGNDLDALPASLREKYCVGFSSYCREYREWFKKRFPDVSHEAVLKFSDKRSVYLKSVSKKNPAHNVPKNEVYKTYCKAFT